MAAEGAGASERLSVVIPTRNRSQLVGRAIESALAEGAEVVVVDDGSTDSTRERVTSYSGQGVVYLRLDTGRGPGPARNLGVEHATGSIVLFLDDDDWLLPGGGSVIVGAAEKHPTHRLYLHNCEYPDGSPSIDPGGEAVELAYEPWLRGEFAAELKPVIRREAFAQYRFGEGPAGGEGLVWGRVIRDHGALVCRVPCVHYELRGGRRISSAAGLLMRDAENTRLAEQWLAEFGHDQRQLSPSGWTERVLAAAAYNVMIGRPERGRQLVDDVPPALLGRRARIAFATYSRLPRVVARLAFIVRRRELALTVREGLLRRALFG